ncbi:phosphoribosylanthranilate isomerase [Hymenobacter rubidus]|uniref:phosphoribosylanthranilate isomerase n=1 Tax=Hymenobacter rubidus TaxID=1441626 RepID=UPI0019200715|nr:phosphoribosylanthranilate isomerase [Hymenobacter rubidus]
METILNEKPLLIKVCGMREPGNIAAVAELQPDFLGFVFYPPSPRYVVGTLPTELLRALPDNVRKIGVFVNESTEHILATLASYGLDGAQLHGQETPAQCAELQRAGVLVIKMFSVNHGLDLSALLPYEGVCDYFVFDTFGPAPGGNGTAFDWEVLRDYELETPYLLAGGLGPENIDALTALRLPGLIGVDFNSRFETAPGLKDFTQLAKAFASLRPRRAGKSARRTA